MVKICRPRAYDAKTDIYSFPSMVLAQICILDSIFYSLRLQKGIHAYMYNRMLIKYFSSIGGARVGYALHAYAAKTSKVNSQI